MQCVCPHEVVKACTLHEFHGEPWLTLARQPTLIERHDTGVTHARDNLNLALETHALSLARKAPAEQHLYRTRTSRRELLRGVHRTLPTAMEFSPKPIAADRTRLCIWNRARVGFRRRDQHALEFTKKCVVAVEAIDRRLTTCAFFEMRQDTRVDWHLWIVSRKRREFECIQRKSTAACGGLESAGFRALVFHAPSPAEGRCPLASHSPGASSYSLSMRCTISRSFAAMRLFAR